MLFYANVKTSFDIHRFLSPAAPALLSQPHSTHLNFACVCGGRLAIRMRGHAGHAQYNSLLSDRQRMSVEYPVYLTGIAVVRKSSPNWIKTLCEV